MQLTLVVLAGASRAWGGGHGGKVGLKLEVLGRLCGDEESPGLGRTPGAGNRSEIWSVGELGRPTGRDEFDAGPGSMPSGLASVAGSSSPWKDVIKPLILESSNIYLTGL